jgi:hypothetical protein
MSVSDPDEGEARKKDGMDRVEAHANPVWSALADDVVHYLARRQKTLTTDDVWARIAQVSPVVTRDNRAMGPVMRRAARAGWVVKTDSTEKTDRPKANRRDIRIWKSRIYRAEPQAT